VKALLVVAAVGIGALCFALAGGGSRAPAPVRVAVAREAPPPPPIPDPVAPPIDVEAARLAYHDAAGAGEAHPGAAAFRSFTDDYVEFNPEVTRAHMQAEGLTLDEVRELTFFALLVRRTVEWDDVEALLGRHVPPAARDAVRDAVHAHSEEMKSIVREHVAAGDPPPARMQSILMVERSYLDDYFARTGMTWELLDELLRMAVVPDAVALEPPDPPAPGEEFELRPGWRAIELTPEQAAKLEKK
jgi:hypothetical protein